ncbi:hypothetical protein DPMN_158905 [Dreissena polymorpha]|uniref:Uncharacterized protein n=1 Tax=Dreissena polymorpha TaxID=45954 RepID=A0A9D4EN88_DREPO|nr:hypothetical protein DPMN_158905 [Dreissena polymorpha]
MQCCDILCCYETRFSKDDAEVDTSMKGFYQYRQDTEVKGNMRPAHGLVEYSKLRQCVTNVPYRYTRIY